VHSSVKMSAQYSMEVKKASGTMLGRGRKSKKRRKNNRLLYESREILKTACILGYLVKSKIEFGKHLNKGTRLVGMVFI